MLTDGKMCVVWNLRWNKNKKNCWRKNAQYALVTNWQQRCRHQTKYIFQLISYIYVLHVELMALFSLEEFRHRCLSPIGLFWCENYFAGIVWEKIRFACGKRFRLNVTNKYFVIMAKWTHAERLESTMRKAIKWTIRFHCELVAWSEIISASFYSFQIGNKIHSTENLRLHGFIFAFFLSKTKYFSF